jgi:hypothetical protein
MSKQTLDAKAHYDMRHAGGQSQKLLDASILVFLGSVYDPVILMLRPSGSTRLVPSGAVSVVGMSKSLLKD